MDRFEVPGWLEWWANRSTLLGSVEVSLVVGGDDAGWDALGRLTHDEDADGFAFLCSLDPVFVLRFADQSTIPVDVHAADDHRRFTLSEHTEPAGRHVSRLDI